MKMKHKIIFRTTKLLFLTIFVYVFLSGNAFAGTYNATDIVMTPGSDITRLNFNWYTTSQSSSLVQIALKSDMPGSEFPEASASSFYCETSSAVFGYYSNKAVVTSLLPSTEYVYRIGDGNGNWSDNYYVTTYAGDAFGFIAVGDPQIGASSTSSDSEGWADTLTRAISQFSETAFILSAGDQVQTNSSESHFHGFFSPDELKNIPVAPALGNHDTGAPNTGYHFNLPNLSSMYGITYPGSADYYFTYGNALFIILNSNNISGTSHESFISETINANPDCKWRIVMFHHDIYGSGSHALETVIMNLRAALYPIFDEYNIDIVITGHDHSYTRTHVLYGDVVQDDQTYDNNGAIVDPDGTVYFTLNSASGSKYYSLNTSQASYVAVREQIYVPTFSYVSINGDSLTFTTYRTDTMSETDTFSIVKTGEEETTNVISTRIASDMDDVEEFLSDGTMYTNSSDLELIYDPGNGENQLIGLRFNNLAIPIGATITKAYLQFTCDETGANEAELVIAAEDADNAQAFTNILYDVSSRETTFQTVNWSPSAWDTVAEAGMDQRTPDISCLIQEVVNRSGWEPGNSLAVIISGESGSRRCAESYAGNSSTAPLLYIEYEVPGN